MGNYNSGNCIVLMKHGDGGKMLLLHTRYDGTQEYIVGSNFAETRYDGALGYEHMDYSWDWGHYFQDAGSAIDYWQHEVLGWKDVPRKCPACGSTDWDYNEIMDSTDGRALFDQLTCNNCGQDYELVFEYTETRKGWS